jgi:hypothetical protein
VVSYGTVPARLVLEAEGFGAIEVATGTVDLSDLTGPSDALILPSLPDLLRQAADAIESAMTTGPPDGWLEPDAPAVCSRHGRSLERDARQRRVERDRVLLRKPPQP